MLIFPFVCDVKNIATVQLADWFLTELHIMQCYNVHDKLCGHIFYYKKLVNQHWSYECKSIAMHMGLLCKPKIPRLSGLI